MFSTSKTMPRIAIQAIGIGLFLMALFTMMWTGIAESGLAGNDHYIMLILSSCLASTFLGYGIRLLMAAANYPKLTTEADKAAGKAMLKRYGIIFGIEFTAIPVVAVLLFLSDNQQYILPAMSLIIGLHFYPMAKLFSRTIDYYIATWTVLCGLSSIWIINHPGNNPMFWMSFLGVGVALATSSYGIYMLIEGRRLIRKYPAKSLEKGKMKIS